MINKKRIFSLIFLFLLLSAGLAFGIDFSFGNSDLNRKLLELYEASPSIFQENNLHIIAICYALEKEYIKSEDIFKKYLTQYPNNFKAIRGLGNTYAIQGKDKEAKELYKRAWELNDIDSLAKLLIIHLKHLELDEIKKILPDLLANKNESLDLKKGLLIYSIISKPPDKELFLEVLDLIDIKDINSDEKFKQSVINGIEKFKLENMKRELGL